MAPLVFLGRVVSFACSAGGFFGALEVAVEVFVEVAGFVFRGLRRRCGGKRSASCGNHTLAFRCGVRCFLAELWRVFLWGVGFGQSFRTEVGPRSVRLGVFGVVASALSLRLWGALVAFVAACGCRPPLVDLLRNLLASLGMFSSFSSSKVSAQGFASWGAVVGGILSSGGFGVLGELVL